jgi:hypothetical protein
MGKVGEQKRGLPKVACLNKEGDVLEVDDIAQPQCQLITQLRQTPATELVIIR